MLTKCIRTKTIAFLLIFGIGFGVFQNQADANEKKATDLLRKVEKNMKNVKSYTLDQITEVRREIATQGEPKTNKIKSSFLFETPYIFLEIGKGVSGSQKELDGAGQESNAQQFIIGRYDQKSGRLKAYMKSKLSDHKWQNTDKLSLSFFNMDGCKGCSSFSNLSKLEKRLKHISLDGSETIHGVDCWKVSARVREDAVKKDMEKILQGPMKKMVTDHSISIPSSKMTFWIRKDSYLIEKIQNNSIQKIDMTINLGGKTRTQSIKQTKITSKNYKNYGNTTVPKKYKKTFKELIKKKDK